MSEFDPNSQPVAPATPTATDTPAPATSGQSTPPAAIQSGQAPNPANVGSQSTATSGAPEGWVPPHRLRETREAAAREARAYVERVQAEYEARLQAAEDKVRALAGFGPQPNPEVETVKSQFFQLFPQFKNLDESKVEALLKLAERAGDLDEQNAHYWQSHGQRAVNSLFSMAEKDLGGPLSEEAKVQLHRSLIGYVESSPETIQAYTSDPNFITNFWKAWSSSFIEPVRRVSAASAQGRAGMPVPQDTPGQVRTAPQTKPANMDERLSAGWQSYQNTRRG